MASSGVAQHKTSLSALVSAIDKELESELFSSTLAAVVIRDCKTDDILFAKHADVLLRPASNAKLFTSAAAVLALPPAYAMETSVSTLDSGRQVLRCSGGADPLLTVQDIQKLAEIAAAKIDSTLDTLYMDASLLDGTFYGSGWMWDDEIDPFMPYLHPFCLERNSIRISMRAPAKRSLPVEVNVFPSSSFVQVEQAFKSGARNSYTVTKKPRSNNIFIDGTMKAGRRRTKRLSMWRPQDIVADLFLSELRRLKVHVDSTVVRHTPGIGSPRKLGSVRHGINDVLKEMNTESDNLCAEMALRHLAVHGGKRSDVTASDGLSAMRSTLTHAGLDVHGVNLKDGSGISFYNLVTARRLSDLLTLMSGMSGFPRFASSLAIGGRTGTLKGRMKDLDRDHMFWGKTGTVKGVSALSGYAQAPQGRLVSVVILMQNFTGKHKPYREVQDRIVRHCLAYSAAFKTVRKPQ